MKRSIRLSAVLALAATGMAVADRAGASAPPDVSGEITVWAMGAEGDNLDVLADGFMEEFPDASSRRWPGARAPT
jgi:multiple sugar transport system substrate-binding protein